MRVVLALAVLVTAAATAAGTASAGQPGGRHLKGAVFSAGVAGGSGASQTKRLGGAAPLGGLVRVSDDAASASPIIPPDPFEGTVYLGSEVEPMVAVSSASPRRQVGFYQEDRWSDGGARSLVLATTVDGGRTWLDQPVAGISLTFGGTYERVTDPWVAFGPDNRVYGFTLAFDQSTARNGLFVNASSDGGLTWGPPVPVKVDTEIAFFNDKNAIAADDFAASPFRGNVYTAWDRLASLDPTGDSFTGPALLSRSTDGGASFSEPQIVFDTKAHAQTIGNVPVVLPDGTLVIGGTYIGPRGAQFLYAVRSADGGRTFSKPTIFEQEPTFTIPDVRGGDLVPSFAVDRRTGRLYAAWEDSRPSVGARDDILVSSSDDEGGHWSAPVQANDTPPGAQSAFTPAIQVDAKGRVGVLYYDLRDDASSAVPPLLTVEWLAVSNDGGRHFGPSERVTPTFDQTASPNAGGFFLGDYQALGAAGDGFQAFFAADLLPQADGALGSDIFSARLP